MKKYSLYHIVSFSNFILHSLLCILIFTASFLPFRANYNFYEVFRDFFGTPIAPILMWLWFVIICIFSFLAIRRSIFSVAVPFIELMFYIFICIPLVFDVFFIGLSEYMSGNKATVDYGIGFYIIMNTSYILIFDITFVIFTIAYSIFSKEGR